MRTVYYDMNDITVGAVGVFMHDARVMPAGVTLTPLPVQEKNESGYAEFAEKDVHFIFRDDVPAIDFYTAPRVDVFARTTGGLLATLGEDSDAEGGAPIVLINEDKQVFRAAKNMMDLLTSTNWKDGVREEHDVRVYPDRAAAEAELEFVRIELPQQKTCIRRADVADAARLAEIEIFNYRLNFYPIFRSDAFYFGELQVPELMTQYERNAGLLMNTYVYDDGVAKGFVRIVDGEVQKLFVEPVLQRQGIGGKLIEFAVQEKQANNLWALEKNDRAIAFYQRHGFRLTGDRRPEEDTTEYLVRMER